MNPTEVSSALTAEAFARESLDNITVIVAYLHAQHNQEREHTKEEKSVQEEDEASTEEADVIIHPDQPISSSVLPSTEVTTSPHHEAQEGAVEGGSQG